MSLLDYKSFLKESYLFEGEIKGWKKYMYDELSSYANGISYTEGETGELRANFGGDPAAAQEKILGFFRDHLGLSDATIEDLGVTGKLSNVPHTQYDGKNFKQTVGKTGSDSYPTYKITSGDKIFYVVNNGATGRNVGKKTVTAKELQITDITFTSSEELVNVVVGKLESEKKSFFPPALPYMIDCANSVMSQTSAGIWDSVEDLLADSTNWRSTITLSKSHKSLSDKDIKDITNDFGEILDGIFLLKAVSNVSTSDKPGLVFPFASNNPLSDLELDGIRVSSKAEGTGGTPSIQPLVEEIAKVDDQYLIDNGIGLTKDEQEVKDMFNYVSNNLKRGAYLDSIETYLYFAEQLEVKGEADKEVLSRLNYLRKNITGGISKSFVVDFLDSLTPDKREKWVNDYWKETGFANKKKIDYSQKGNDLIGTVYYPLATEVVNLLNKYYSEALTHLVRKFIVYKQVYLKVDAKKDPDTLSFSGISSRYVPKVIFSARASTKNWNAGMGFEFAS